MKHQEQQLQGQLQCFQTRACQQRAWKSCQQWPRWTLGVEQGWALLQQLKSAWRLICWSGQLQVVLQHQVVGWKGVGVVEKREGVGVDLTRKLAQLGLHLQAMMVVCLGGLQACEQGRWSELQSLADLPFSGQLEQKCW